MNSAEGEGARPVESLGSRAGGEGQAGDTGSATALRPHTGTGTRVGARPGCAAPGWQGGDPACWDPAPQLFPTPSFAARRRSQEL